MSYIVATGFNQSTWEKYGLNWIRFANSESLKAVIVGDELTGAAVDKIHELGFVHLPVQPKFNIKSNFYYTLLQKLEKNQRCLWTIPSILPKSEIQTDVDLVCGVSDFAAEYLTSGVVNLYDRAAMIQSLNEKIWQKHGGFLSSEYILGTFDFWNGFVGCQTYLHERQYLDSNATSDDLIINFFVAFTNSISCKIQKYPTKEAA